MSLRDADRQADLEKAKHGIWRHYKGPLYQVFAVGHDADADVLTVANDAEFWDEDNFRSIPLGERLVVIYVGLQLDGAHLGPRVSIRTLHWFLGKKVVPGPVAKDWVEREHRVAVRYGEVEEDLWEVDRFVYLGPELTTAMLS